MTRALLFQEALKALAILVAASVIGLAVNASRTESLPLVQDWDETMVRRQTEKLLPEGIAVLDTGRMAEIYRNKNVVILDARPEDFHSIERIPGARSLPLEEADRLIPGLLKDLPAGTRIITYCDDVLCPAGLKLGLKLVRAGYPDVAVYLEGLSGWTAQGMPVAGGN